MVRVQWNIWKAPSKRGVYRLRCKFLSSSESTEVRHADSYVINCPRTFFLQAGKQGFKDVHEPPHPPIPMLGTPLNTHAQWFQFSRIKGGRGRERERERGVGGGGGGWGWGSRNFVHIFLAAWEKKNRDMAYFSGFCATLKITMKSVYIRVSSTEPFISWMVRVQWNICW